ncbi:MAG TPA: septation protein SpoVG [candidate division Zixibacteria bacterium]|nr:septation protein SpoVG [candidate division Zixibacteria bacterium]
MEITEIRFTMRNEEKLRAFANVTFDDSFVIRGLKVISGSRGFFVSMPSRRRPDGTYQDVAHPINTEMRRHLESMVLEAYEREVKLWEERHKSALT